MSLRHKLIAAALIPVLVIVLVQARLRSFQQQLKSAQDRVAVLDHVEERTGTIAADLLAAEISLRDLILTKSAFHSARFSEEASQAAAGFKALADLLSDDPLQSRRAASAAEIALARIRILDNLRRDVVSRKTDSMAASSRLAASNPLWFEARRRMRELAAEENRLLELQELALAQSRKTVSNWLDITAVLRALLLLSIGLALYRGQVARIHQLVAAAKDYSLGRPFPRIKAHGDEIGLLTAALISATDQVLEQKLQLAKQEEYLELALRSAQVGVWECDLLRDTLSLGVQGASSAWHAGQPVVIKPKEFQANVHPDDVKLLQTIFSEQMEGKSRVGECEFRHKEASGKWLWLHFAGRVTAVSAGGAPIRFTGTYRDITTRKEIEQDLAATNRKLTAVLESAVGVAIMATDLENRITLFNVGAEKMLGYAGAEVLGEPLRLFLDPGECEVRGDEVPGVDSPVDPRPRTYIRKHGTRVLVTQVVNALRDANGEVCGRLLVAVDVTSQAILQEELRAANGELQILNRRAEEATAAKSRFLALMSHEIRTPMNGVLGLTELLLDTPLTNHQRRLLETLQSSGDLLLALLNEILDISKIEAGKLELEDTNFALEPTVRSVFDLIASKGTSKGLNVDLAFEDAAVRFVLGDPIRLKQIVSNLLSNAVKFTAVGSVRVDVRLLRDGGSEGTFEIAVHDSGIGIPLEEQERIFESFEQASASTTREFGGTGLGLAIAKRLVEMMGGTLTLESEPGKGATFRVNLTLRYSSVAPAKVKSAVGRQGIVQGIRILVAEDEPTNQLLTRSILENAGFQVRIVGDGEEAVKAATSGNYDLILMDARMPKLDGLAATKVIRGMPGKKGTTPIIALTAGASAEDRESCVQAGMDDFLTKPFQGAELVAKCNAWGASRRLISASLPRRSEPYFMDLETYPADFAMDLVRLFLETSPPRFAELLAAIRNGDAQVVRDSAHFLRGGLCSSVMPSLERRLREIESKSRAAEPIMFDQDTESLTALFTFACDSARKWLGEASSAVRV